jgi:hypothetical protein
MLRAYINYHQTDWDLLLPMMEFAYNNSTHASTGVSPFLLNYGHHPLVPVALLQPPPTNVPALSDFIEQQHSALSRAQEAIFKAQDHQKTQADKHRRSTTFEVGDEVLLSADNISVAARKNRPSRKLEPKYIGPYKIIRKVNDNAFELALPANMKQHPVFNTDLLRAYTASPPEFGQRSFSRQEPEETEDGSLEWEVDKILDYKVTGRTPKWLVLWKGYPIDEASWEPRDAFKNAQETLDDFERSRKK